MMVMRDEYNFSKGERDKFYHPDAEFLLPVYLEPDIAEFLHQLAVKKHVEVDEIVNDWLRRDIGLIQTVTP